MMTMGRGTQQRGGSQPSGPELLSRIVNIENKLGIQGSNPLAFFAVTDTTGLQRVRVGFLPNGDYGVLVADTLGNTEEYLPTSSAFNNSVISVSSLTYASPAGSPSVTAIIGKSGNARIEVGSSIFTSGGASGYVGLTVDGAVAFTSPVLVQAAAAIAASNYGARLLETWTVAQGGPGLLTPGEHTFTLAYAAGSGGATFEANFLAVQPL
jgi:hypothetical protein